MSMPSGVYQVIPERLSVPRGKLSEGPSTVVGDAISTPSNIPPQSLCGSFLPCRVLWAALCSMLFSAGAQLSSRGLGLQESRARGSSGCLLVYTGPGPPSRSGSENSHIISMSTHSFRHPQTSCVPHPPQLTGSSDTFWLPH